MPPAYTGSGELFNDLGPIVQAIQDLGVLVKTTWPTRKTTITDAVKAGTTLDRDALIGRIQNAYNQHEASGEGLREELRNALIARIMDRTHIEDLGLDAKAASLPGVLAEQIRDMKSRNFRVTESTVTLGARTVSGTGNGTILLSDKLDGVNRPGANFHANPEYAGVTSQLVVSSDDIRAEVYQDSQTNGVPEGTELFRVHGETNFGLFSSLVQGSQRSAVMRNGNGKNLFANADFESWSSGVLNSWDYATGVTGGTHVIQESATADIHRGVYGVKMVGDGSLANIQIEQAIDQSLFKPNEIYCVAINYKADAVPVAGDLTIQFEGTGYTASSTEKISVAAASLSTSWALEHFFVVFPEPIPTDMKLVLSWNNTPTLNNELFLDSLVVAKPDYYGGVAMMPVAGSTAWQNGDRVSFTISNDEAGEWQTIFKQAFGVQLHTGTGGTLINDSLIV